MINGPSFQRDVLSVKVWKMYCFKGLQLAIFNKHELKYWRKTQTSNLNTVNFLQQEHVFYLQNKHMYTEYTQQYYFCLSSMILWLHHILQHFK
jgi:hypothetical protein